MAGGTSRWSCSFSGLAEGNTSRAAYATLAFQTGATLTDIAETVHAHPTLPEAFLEAVESAVGHAIRVVKCPRSAVV